MMLAFSKTWEFQFIVKQASVFLERCDGLVLSFSQVDSDEEGGCKVVSHRFILSSFLCNKRTSKVSPKLAFSLTQQNYAVHCSLHCIVQWIVEIFWEVETHFIDFVYFPHFLLNRNLNCFFTRVWGVYCAIMRAYNITVMTKFSILFISIYMQLCLISK